FIPRLVEVLQFLTAEALDGDDGAVLLEVLCGRLFDDVLHAGVTEDFHGALVEGGGSGMNGGSAMFLDDQIRYAVVGEEEGCGEADEASSNNQYGCVVGGNFAVAHFC